MKKLVTLGAAALLATFDWGARAHAAGFLIYDLSAEALGKGSAVSASTQEPAAVWFNPAALAFMGHGVSASVVGIRARATYEAPDGAETSTVNNNHALPTLFANARVHERVALGFGVYPAFGLEIEWPGDWVGKEFTTKARITTVALNPTVAIQIAPALSLAAGFSAVRGVVELENALPAVVGGTSRVGAATWGWAGNAALLYRPLPDVLHFALTYRSRTKLSFDGRADFDPSPDFAPSLPDQGASAEITLPDILSAGVMWRPLPNWTFTFDPNLVFWSTIEELVIDFQSAPTRVLKRDNHASVTLRFGGEWGAPGDGLRLRAGFIFDQNPSPAETLAPSLPDANRLDFGLGVGYKAGAFKADLGYLLVYFLPSESTGGTEGPIGTYRSIAQLLGLTLTAQFGP
jgi:long-chain fatty acid transport protein